MVPQTWLRNRKITPTLLFRKWNKMGSLDRTIKCWSKHTIIIVVEIGSSQHKLWPVVWLTPSACSKWKNFWEVITNRYIQGLSLGMLRSKFWWGIKSHSACDATHCFCFLIVFLYLQCKTSNRSSWYFPVSSCNSSVICCHSNVSLTPPLSCSPSLYAMK